MLTKLVATVPQANEGAGVTNTEVRDLTTTTESRDGNRGTLSFDRIYNRLQLQLVCSIMQFEHTSTWLICHKVKYRKRLVCGYIKSISVGGGDSTFQ
jgi:hypothetical protein